MSEHKAKLAEGIVTSDRVHGYRRLRLPKKILLPAVSLIVIAVFGGGGFLVYKVYIQNPSHKKTGTTSDRNSNAYLLHPDKQVSAAQTELNKAKTPKEKAAAYDTLAQAYLNNKQPTNAVDAISNSLSADSSTSNKLQALNVLGYAYSRAGQQDKAIASFQQMIDIIKASGDDSLKQEIPRVQSAISEIQQGQTL
jgi:tetratricopeptide (TPR) repeat protein